VRLHTSLPYFIAGLQIAAPAAFLGAMVGEFTGAERGMGVLTIRAMRGLDVSATWALALIASLVSMFAYWGLGWFSRKLGMTPPALIMTAPRQDARRSIVTVYGSRLATAGVTVLLTLAIWQVAMDGFGLNPYFAKRPADVWAFLVTAPEAEANRAMLFGAFAQTLSLTALGYGLGLAIGAALAAAIVLAPGLASTTLPFAIALRSIPIVVTAPLIVMALGRGAVGTVVIVAIMIFFPTLVACLQGMRQTPGQVSDVFDSYAASRWHRIVHAQIPAMLPAFFASARMAVPAAFLAATTAEWLATGIGIGGLMAVTASTSGYTMLWSAIVLISAFASLAYLVAGAVEQAVLRVYAAEQTV
jgi:ABC-type nitrate/sulfonate/bicarbonate transport system permease component